MSDEDLRDLERLAGRSIPDFVRWARALSRAGETRPLEFLRELRATCRDYTRWLSIVRTHRSFTARLNEIVDREMHARLVLGVSPTDPMFYSVLHSNPALLDRARRLKELAERIHYRWASHLRRSLSLARAVLALWPGTTVVATDFDLYRIPNGAELGPHLPLALYLWKSLESRAPLNRPGRLVSPSIIQTLTNRIDPVHSPPTI